MIGYVTIGYNDADKALKFYDAVLATLSLKRGFFDQGWAGYGKTGEPHSIFLVPPHDGKEASPSNGTMIAFKGASKAEVDAAHAAGLANGGSDEGAPGARPAESTSFYGAYLRDPDGNKFAVYCKP